MAKRKTQTYDKIISLGYNCGVSLVLKRKGLRTEAYPFDSLFTTSIHTINQILERKFESFVEKTCLVDQTSKMDMKQFGAKDKNLMIQHKNYSGLFFRHHDVIKSDEVRVAFQRRARRFQTSLKQKKPILFIRFLCENDNRLNDLHPPTDDKVQSYANVKQLRRLIPPQHHIWILTERKKIIQSIQMDGITFLDKATWIQRLQLLSKQLPSHKQVPKQVPPNSQETSVQLVKTKLPLSPIDTTYSFVFQIGTNKTATKSIWVLLNNLGYDATHWAHNKPRNHMIKQMQKNEPLLAGLPHTAYCDFINVNNQKVFDESLELVKTLKETYRGKFILNYRDPQHWIKSRFWHYKKKNNLMRDFCLWFHWYASVLDVFQDAHHRLLVVDIEKEKAGEQICQFLNQPTQSLPHEHKTQENRCHHLPKHTWYY